MKKILLFLLLLTFVNTGYLLYYFYVNIIDKKIDYNGFQKVSKTQFEKSLNQFAFNDEIFYSYITKKTFLFSGGNLNFIKKYFIIKDSKFDYIKKFTELQKYEKTVWNNFNNCVDYINNKIIKKNTKNTCEKYINSFYMKKNTNVSHIYLSKIDFIAYKILKEYKEKNYDINNIKTILTNECKGHLILGLKDKDKNKIIENLFCNNNQTLNYTNINYIDIKKLRLQFLFYILFKQFLNKKETKVMDYKQKYNELTNNITNVFKNKKDKNILVKTKCKNIGLSPVYIQDYNNGNIKLSKANTNILLNYVKQNYRFKVCIITYFDKSKLKYNKEYSTVLTNQNEYIFNKNDINYNAYVYSAFNLIYKLGKN